MTRSPLEPISDRPPIVIREAAPGDLALIGGVFASSWGGPLVVSRGVVHDLRALPTLIAVRGGEPDGVATYRIDGVACELTSLDALTRHVGVGSALLDAVAARARAAGCARLWLITTNDNLEALRFYQRRGMVLAALHRDALAASRRLKPSIPLVGEHGIDLRDELELEMAL